MRDMRTHDRVSFIFVYNYKKTEQMFSAEYRHYGSSK